MINPAELKLSPQRQVFPHALATGCTIYSVALISVKAMQWDLVDAITPFAMAPLMLFGWLGLVILAVIALFNWMRSQSNPYARVPLLVVVTTFLILVLVPTTSLWLDWQFQTNHSELEEVVRLVKLGEVRPDATSLAHLPLQYRHLSKGGGDILIERSSSAVKVMFFTYRGVLDSFSGFVYSSNDLPPTNGDFEGNWIEIRQIEPHWYFVASS